MSNNVYESLFICPATIPTEEIESLVEKTKQVITQNGGVIITADKWGKRKLAYPIKKQREGFYLYLKFECPPPLIKSLEHFFRINDTIIRHIIVRLSEKPGVTPAAVPSETAGNSEEVKEDGRTTFTESK